MERKRQSKIPQIIGPAPSGRGAHVEALASVEGLDWKFAGVRRQGAPHSIFQLVNHIVFWQDWVLDWFDDLHPAIPKNAKVGWPGGVRPASAKAWEQAVGRLKRGLEGLERRGNQNDLLTRRGDKTSLEMLQTISAHNSYHVGQIVFLRQILGLWPPPSGGLTW